MCRHCGRKVTLLPAPDNGLVEPITKQEFASILEATSFFDGEDCDIQILDNPNPSCIEYFETDPAGWHSAMREMTLLPQAQGTPVADAPFLEILPEALRMQKILRVLDGILK